MYHYLDDAGKPLPYLIIRGNSDFTCAHLHCCTICSFSGPSAEPPPHGCMHQGRHQKLASGTRNAGVGRQCIGALTTDLSRLVKWLPIFAWSCIILLCPCAPYPSTSITFQVAAAAAAAAAALSQAVPYFGIPALNTVSAGMGRLCASQTAATAL